MVAYRIMWDSLKELAERNVKIGEMLKINDDDNTVCWSLLLDLMKKSEEFCEVNKWYNGTILEDMPITIVSAFVVAFAVYGAFQFVMTVIGG